jgi:hypothetical protein
MRKLIFILLVIAVAAPVSAQRINLDFPGLAARASETVDITLDGSLLQLASKFLNRHDPDQAAARDIVSKLEGIYVRSYEFDKEGEYDRSVVEKVRAQLGPNWKKIVTVQSRNKDNVEIYIDSRGDNLVRGLVIINAEPRELTIVNLVGPVDIDKLAALEGEFGIPRMSRGRDRRHED